ncbi:MAG: glycosyltransferase, partial [Treponema sp.]|nr:glycosyltransferase [Treponema sp.]
LELQELISSAEKNSIVFTGFLPDEELKQLLASAKILVQPSLYEGFGIPPLQALYSGTKAIISDIPVFKEIYADLPVCFFKAGNVDDLAQKLASVYFDDAPLPNFKKTYSYKNTANKILNSILEDIRG